MSVIEGQPLAQFLTQINLRSLAPQSRATTNAQTPACDWELLRSSLRRRY